MKTLAEWLNWQEQLHLSAIDLGLDRIRLVASRLGILTPTMPVITVGGTNGKGSTCAMLTQVYLEHGYQVGTFTSPHILHYNERIAINGKPVEDALICRAFEAIEAVRDDVSLTYFEFGALAAVWCFLQHPVDVLILEVGLGGRLDAVNLWDANVALITSIGIDHVEWLGSTREQIAFEKAGIMRANQWIICGDPEPPLAIAVQALAVQARLLQYGRDFQLDASLRLTLQGEAQYRNAACVQQAVQALQTQLAVNTQGIRQGLEKAHLTGRMQQCDTTPSLVLDVAHNAHAVEGVVNWLKTQSIDGKLYAIFSILADKDRASVLQLLKSQFDEWHLVQLQGMRALNCEQLRTEMVTMGITVPIEIHPDFQAAWETIQKRAQTHDKVLAFGSFLVVSGMLDAIHPA